MNRSLKIHPWFRLVLGWGVIACTPAAFGQQVLNPGAETPGVQEEAKQRGAVATPDAGAVDHASPHPVSGARTGTAATPDDDAPPILITEVKNVGEDSLSVTVVGAFEEAREDRIYDIKPETKIRLNGKKADLESLKPGDAARLELSPEDPKEVVEVFAGRVEGKELPERRVVRAAPQQPAADGQQQQQQTAKTQADAWVGAMVTPTPYEALIITQVTAESPSAEADLRVGDFIVGINGEVPPQLPYTMELAQVIGTEPGTEVSLMIWREHQKFPTYVVVGSGSQAAQRSAAFRGTTRRLPGAPVGTVGSGAGVTLDIFGGALKNSGTTTGVENTTQNAQTGSQAPQAQQPEAQQQTQQAAPQNRR